MMMRLKLKQTNGKKIEGSLEEKIELKYEKYLKG